MSDVKICGICDPESLQTAVDSGARYVGFVFYSESPRFIGFDKAAELIGALPKSVRSVGVLVDPDDKELEKVKETGVNMVQLHGSETPERVMEIRDKIGLQVMKALRVATKYDLEDLEEYEACADWLLFDAKPPGADLPGGTGQSFDWSLLTGKTFQKPWMLSGGLTEDNVADAITLLNPKVVDVSSGVETTPGQKDSNKIINFINIVKNQ